MGQRLACKRQNYKSLQKEDRYKSYDLGSGNGFLNITLKAQATEEKIDET